MATTTPNFGWPVPTSTDLVKDGATAIEALGDGIDTSMVDLKGGTTGQILAKATSADMDFAWITNDVGDITGVTATSPLTGGGTSGAITVGIDDATTSVKGAVQLSDSTSTTSSVLAATPTAVKSAYDLANAASVNLLLNANFAINQRAYVSAANLASGSYGFDRWKSNYTNTTLTFTASTQGQSITINASGGLQQVIEQGLVPAGTYTLAWTGTATGRVYNSGGTPPSYAASPVTFTADGTANVVVEFTASGATKTLSKVQFNVGTNTTWNLATPTLQSELAACQRYYMRWSALQNYYIGGRGNAQNTTTIQMQFSPPTTMRVTPISLDYSNIQAYDEVTGFAISPATIQGASNPQNLQVVLAVSGATQFRTYTMIASGGNGYLGFSAEL